MRLVCLLIMLPRVLVVVELSQSYHQQCQVDKARGPQCGTGLGLAITQEIVHAHGGEIRIESGGQNKGTTVKVTLPLVRKGEKK